MKGNMWQNKEGFMAWINSLDRDLFLLYFILGAVSMALVGILFCNPLMEHELLDVDFLWGSILGVVLWVALCIVSFRFYWAKCVCAILSFVALFLYAGMIVLYSLNETIVSCGLILFLMSVAATLNLDKLRMLMIVILLALLLAVDIIAISHYIGLGFVSDRETEYFSFGYGFLMLLCLSVFAIADCIQTKRFKIGGKPVIHLQHFIVGWIFASLAFFWMGLDDYIPLVEYRSLEYFNLTKILITASSCLVSFPMVVWPLLQVGLKKAILTITSIILLIVLMVILMPMIHNTDNDYSILHSTIVSIFVLIVDIFICVWSRIQITKPHALENIE